MIRQPSLRTDRLLLRPFALRQHVIKSGVAEDLDQYGLLRSEWQRS